ncbi:MAG: magnesium-dependent phosphatase-1 [Candidatus Methanofastidiosia archaeon]
MLIILDGDGTLWDGDLLAGYLQVPLKVVDEDTVEDFNGRRVTLRKETREVLKRLKEKEIYVALASQNTEIPVISVLRRLKISKYFNFLELGFNEKDVMVLNILEKFRKKGRDTGKVFFLDDFEYNIKMVKSNPDLEIVICINTTELESLLDIFKLIKRE